MELRLRLERFLPQAGPTKSVGLSYQAPNISIVISQNVLLGLLVQTV